MEINRLNVNEVVIKSGLKPDKDYGQNYLIEPSICQKIVGLLDLKDEDHVLEIGPGIGSLTHFLNDQKGAKLDLVDIDQRMTDFLKIIYSKNNTSIITNDIRKHDVTSYTKIIGNLPYNITTETVTYLLKNAKNAERLVLMCQAETYAHFSDVSGKEYGPVSVLIHLLGKIESKFSVKPGSFYPAPKCSSTVFVISFTNRDNFDSCWGAYLLAKQLFLNRRKTIHNNLSNYLKDKSLAERILLESNIELNKRPEEIDPATYLKLLDKVQTIR